MRYHLADQALHTELAPKVCVLQIYRGNDLTAAVLASIPTDFKSNSVRSFERDFITELVEDIENYNAVSTIFFRKFTRTRLIYLSAVLSSGGPTALHTGTALPGRYEGFCRSPKWSWTYPRRVCGRRVGKAAIQGARRIISTRRRTTALAAPSSGRNRPAW